MKKIRPYKTEAGLMKALDNGGRFFNFLTSADDGQIEKAELARVAGVYTDRQKMALYLEMAVFELGEEKAGRVRQALDPQLAAELRRKRIHHFTPAQARHQGVASRAAIVTGVPHYTESKSEMMGFIMVPISNGKTTTMVMIPLIDQYRVYEVRDEATGDDFLIAHERGSRRLPEKRMRLGGVLKKIKAKKGTKPKHDLYLEAIYYTPAS
jgi:hypothetical protein